MITIAITHLSLSDDLLGDEHHRGAGGSRADLGGRGFSYSMV